VISDGPDETTKLRWISPNIKQILGFDASDIESEKIEWKDCVHPDDLKTVSELMARIWDEGKGEFEYRIRDSEGRVRWVREARRVVYAKDGSVEIVGSLEDLTAVHRSRQREQMLRRELDHRVKNNLQIILGECGKVIRAKNIEREQIEVLTSRISSMALVHQVLAARSWSPIDLRDLIRHVEGAMVDASVESPVVLTGPSLMVGVDAAMTMATVLNELATNATKYGGLSDRGEGIAVRWRVQEADQVAILHLDWIECVEGSGIQKPQEMGFGMQLIEGMIPYELGGEVTVQFEPSGLQFMARIPLDRFQADLGEARLNVSDE
jgi:PAS domain S-box-containing protein